MDPVNENPAASRSSDAESARKTAAFRNLHEAGCFVLPNPWDRGSAKFLESIGFKALATSSAALAFSLGRPDTPTSLDRDATLANVRDIVDATHLPVQADFQDGYGVTLEAIAASVQLCVETGVAGLSIEDATGHARQPLYSLPDALARLRAARSAIDATGQGVVLTARAECFLVGHPEPLKESIERLVAYADAGADCVFAPGLRSLDDIAKVVAAVAPKPLNVLTADPIGMSVRRLADVGVRRISVGSAFARTAWRSFIEAAREVSDLGTFSRLANAEPFETFDDLFGPR